MNTWQQLSIFLAQFAVVRARAALARSLCMPEFRGDTGLSAAEREAHARCAELACKHERCYKRTMYQSPAKQYVECTPLMQQWRECFAETKAAVLAGKAPPSPDKQPSS